MARSSRRSHRGRVSRRGAKRAIKSAGYTASAVVHAGHAAAAADAGDLASAGMHSAEAISSLAKAHSTACKGG